MFSQNVVHAAAGYKSERDPQLPLFIPLRGIDLLNFKNCHRHNSRPACIGETLWQALSQIA